MGLAARPFTGAEGERGAGTGGGGAVMLAREFARVVDLQDFEEICPPIRTRALQAKPSPRRYRLRSRCFSWWSRDMPGLTGSGVSAGKDEATLARAFARQNSK